VVNASPPPASQRASSTLLRQTRARVLQVSLILVPALPSSPPPPTSGSLRNSRHPTGSRGTRQPGHETPMRPSQPSHSVAKHQHAV
jgi:hypothetical protein